MVNALYCRSSVKPSSSNQGHCVMLLGNTQFSFHIASSRPGVQMHICKFNAKGTNPVME